MSGVDMLTIADVLGHKTLQMVKRYAHLSDQHKAEALTKLSESLSLVRAESVPCGQLSRQCPTNTKGSAETVLSL